MIDCWDISLELGHVVQTPLDQIILLAVSLKVLSVLLSNVLGDLLLIVRYIHLLQHVVYVSFLFIQLLLKSLDLLLYVDELFEG